MSGAPGEVIPSCDTLSATVARLVWVQIGRTLAVDEIEKHELPVTAPAEDTPRQTPFRGRLLARAERLCLGQDRSDLVPVGKALRQHGGKPTLP